MLVLLLRGSFAPRRRPLDLRGPFAGVPATALSVRPPGSDGYCCCDRRAASCSPAQPGTSISRLADMPGEQDKPAGSHRLRYYPAPECAWRGDRATSATKTDSSRPLLADSLCCPAAEKSATGLAKRGRRSGSSIFCSPLDRSTTSVWVRGLAPDDPCGGRECSENH